MKYWNLCLLRIYLRSSCLIVYFFFDVFGECFVMISGWYYCCVDIVVKYVNCKLKFRVRIDNVYILICCFKFK